MKFRFVTLFGVKFRESEDGRVVIHRHEKRERLRRPVFGNKVGRDIWWTVQVDGKHLKDGPKRGVTRFWVFSEAVGAAAVAVGESHSASEAQ